MEFHPVGLSDGEWIRAALRHTEHKSCEESFANLLTWGKRYGVTVAEIDGTLVCKANDLYTLPIGQNREAVLQKLLPLYGKEKIKMFGVEDGDFPLLEKYFCHIRAEYKREYSDYVYDKEALSELHGKKLAAKRNHINAFEKEYPDWYVEDITGQNMGEVISFQQRWQAEHSTDEALMMDETATHFLLENFRQTGMKGLVLYAGRQMVAYSFGEAITNETFCVHVEKALPQVRGAYPMINREFVRRFCEGYRYINREDDMGEAGLRKAKLSYAPAFLVNKYQAEMEKK